MSPPRADTRFIASLAASQSRVLDVGCGEGELLAYLRDTRQTQGQGLEINHRRVAAAMAKGLAVIQGDADSDLAHYPDDAFDLAVLAFSLQSLSRPAEALAHLLRVARRAVVVLANQAHWRARARLAFRGLAPITHADAPWHETPDIHPCSLRDFVALCQMHGIAISACVAFSASGHPRRARLRTPFLANLLSPFAAFVLERPETRS